MTLCFCTGSYAGAAGRRLLFTRLLLNNFSNFFHFRHDCWPIDYLIRFWSIFIVTLTLNFQGQIWNLLYLTQKWSDCHETKQTYRLNSRPQMWPSGLTLAMTLSWNFQGQIHNLLYLNQKWSHCHETKNKHIDWTIGLKCDHWVWPWTWPWLWVFKVKYEICYISAKSGLKVRCSDLPDCDWGDFKCRRAVDSSSFEL